MTELKLEYKLNYDEIYEALLALARKAEGKRKKFAAASMMVICAVYILFFWARPENLAYLLIAIICLIMYLLIEYYNPYRRRKKARKMASMDGVYKVTIYEEGAISGYKADKLKFDKKTKAIETENIFVISPYDRVTYCIPKKILSEERICWIREVLRSTVQGFVSISIKTLQ